MNKQKTKIKFSLRGLIFFVVLCSLFIYQHIKENRLLKNQAKKEYFEGNVMQLLSDMQELCEDEYKFFDLEILIQRALALEMPDSFIPDSSTRKLHQLLLDSARIYEKFIFKNWARTTKNSVRLSDALKEMLEKLEVEASKENFALAKVFQGRFLRDLNFLKEKPPSSLQPVSFLYFSQKYMKIIGDVLAKLERPPLQRVSSRICLVLQKYYDELKQEQNTLLRAKDEKTTQFYFKILERMKRDYPF